MLIRLFLTLVLVGGVGGGAVLALAQRQPSVAEATAGVIPSSIVATATQIHLTGGNIVATSKVNVQGIDVSVGVVASAVVENGQTTIVVKEIQTGGLPLPDGLKHEIQAQIGQTIDPRAFGVPLDISKLQIVDGKLVITGTAKP